MKFETKIIARTEDITMYEELLIGLRGHAKRGGCDKRCPSYGAENRGYATCSEELAEKAAAAIEELTATAESYKRSMEAWADEAARARPRLVSVTTRLPDEWKSVLTCVTRKCVPLPEPPKEDKHDVQSEV